MDSISYEQFGVNFVTAAVSPERVKSAIADVSGDTVDVGPMPAGPGGIATAKATGEIGAVEVHRIEGPTLKFQAKLPIDLQLEVTVAAVPQRYEGLVEVPLLLTVHTVAPLTLLIEIKPVVPRDITVKLESSGLGAGVLQRVGNIDDEVRKQVAQVVNERVGFDEAKASREIDVHVLIEEAMAAERAEAP